MSYRRHRFTYYHQAQEAGVAQITSSVASHADTPLYRLIDGVHGLMWKIVSATTATVITVDTVAISIPHRPVTNRFLIPNTHNLWEKGVAIILDYDDGGGDTRIDLVTGEQSLVVCPAPGQLIDLELENVSAADLIATLDLPLLDTQEIGQLWWSFTWQPTTGEVQDWERPAPVSNQVISYMESGESYTSVKGQDTLSFRTRHDGVSGADWLGYERLFRYVGTRRTFWYEHSDSGNRRSVLHVFDGSSPTSSTNCAISSTVGPASGSTASRMTLSSTGAAAFSHTLAAITDLRGRLVSIDIQMSDPSLLVADTNVHIFLWSDPTAVSGGTAWPLSRAMRSKQYPSIYYRVFFDPEEQAAIYQSTDYQCDLSKVARVGFGVETSVSGDMVDFANLLVWEKESEPFLCRFVDAPRRTQQSPVPGAGVGPWYTVEMRMEEVLS